MFRRLLAAAVMLCAYGSALATEFPKVDIRKINDRLYALLGPIDVPNTVNRGYMNNSLAIIGDKGVILVDAGSHKRVGEHIGKAIRTVTDKPVTHVLITHHHADHHLGLSAFPGVESISTENCAKHIRKSGPALRANMARVTGLDLSDTQPVLPRTTLPQLTRRAMEIDGVSLELITPTDAHTDGDMMVWLPEFKVLAAGDILVHGVNPNFTNGNLKLWIAAVDELLKLPVDTVLPGHGPLMKREDIITYRALIADFYTTVETLFKKGGTMSDVRPKLDVARWQRMSRFDALFGHNISTVWLQVEADNF